MSWSRVAPLGPAYQAGTLSGNPVAVAAGIATLKSVQMLGVYERLEETASELTAGLQTVADAHEVPVTINRVGSLFSMFFNPGPVDSWQAVTRSDAGAYSRYFHAMLERGVYFAPSAFEAAFVSTVHTPEGPGADADGGGRRDGDGGVGIATLTRNTKGSNPAYGSEPFLFQGDGG